MRQRVAAGLCFILFTINALAAELPSAVFRADDALTLMAVRAFGGVILQSEARFEDATGKTVPLEELQLAVRGDVPCLIRGTICYKIPESRETVARIAAWIVRGRTGAFSMAVDDSADANRLRSTELVPVMTTYVAEECFLAPCFVAREFQNTSAEEKLHDLDFATDFGALSDSQVSSIRDRLNSRPGTIKDCDDMDKEGSYINTDVDSTFVVKLNRPSTSTETRSLTISGVPYRYHWYACPGATMPYFHEIQVLAAVSGNLPKRHNEAVRFAQVTALLRAFERTRKDQLRNLK